MANDDTDEIEEVQLYFVMSVCCFFVLNVIIAACAIRQRNVRYEIESTSRRRKRKRLARDLETMSENFRHFVEMVGPGLKMMAEFVARIAETLAIKEAARKEIEEKKKLLRQEIFEIDGLSVHEAMAMLQVLVKDEDQLKIFLELPDDMKLCYCHVFLARISYRPPSM